MRFENFSVTVSLIRKRPGPVQYSSDEKMFSSTLSGTMDADTESPTEVQAAAYEIVKAEVGRQMMGKRVSTADALAAYEEAARGK